MGNRRQKTVRDGIPIYACYIDVEGLIACDFSI